MKKLIVVTVFISMLVLTGCTTQQEIKCGPGTEMVDGQCVAESVSCEDGFHEENGTCVQDELVCDEGYHDEDGTCVIDELVCDEGYHEENGACVIDELVCDAGYHEENGTCVLDDIVCDAGYHEENGVCVEDELVCEDGYHEEDGTCVIDELVCEDGYHIEFNQCVLDNVDLPAWFDGWTLMTEPVGDLSLNALSFTETGFSVDLPAGKRVGIVQYNVELTAGYYYEVKFDYTSDTAGNAIFVQLQGHSGNVFTNSAVMTTESTESFSQILPMHPDTTSTTGGILAIELLPSGVPASISIDNIEIIEYAMPTCGENEVIKGIECVPANNGYLPNGTPTAWFDGWAILTVPAGNKEISDYNFTETGFTAYLDAGERTGIELMGYVFESGYTYELRFDYTASEAGRMVWVQMEALGGYGFTNTETWTVAGTGTFSQSLVIPDTYVTTETGWIKIELTPGALDNITIDNIEIIKTPNE